MNSVERIQEYLQLEAEEEHTAKGVEPPAAWPSNEGKIEVRNLVATYAPEVRLAFKLWRSLVATDQDAPPTSFTNSSIPY